MSGCGGVTCDIKWAWSGHAQWAWSQIERGHSKLRGRGGHGVGMPMGTCPGHAHPMPHFQITCLGHDADARFMASSVPLYAGIGSGRTNDDPSLDLPDVPLIDGVAGDLIEGVSQGQPCHPLCQRLCRALRPASHRIIILLSSLRRRGGRSFQI
jgi:hypothetical protein